MNDELANAVLQCKINEAIEMVFNGGGFIDGSHHKQYCLDQVLRILLGDKYDEAVAAECDPVYGTSNEDGPNTYSWDEGIAP